jgi:hypothetical protein
MRRVAILAAVFAATAFAHDIPADATIQAFLKPEGHTLRLLVRVPLETMRDLDFKTDERGYLVLPQLMPLLPDAATLWIANFIRISEDDQALTRPRVAALRISLPSDTSFQSWDAAISHLREPGPADNAQLVWSQVLLDVLLEYPIANDRAAFSIDPALQQLAGRINIALRYLPPGGAVRAYSFRGNPGLVRLDPHWYQAAGLFVKEGFNHILDGTDHLLFLLCLVIPFRRFRALIPVVTAFTAAHSITLIASAYGWAPGAIWFPPLIETLIAASIVFMAIENIAANDTVRHRWMLAFGFGLVHGFGFSFALRESMQFAGAHLLTSLLSFNVGVELGQLLVLAVIIPILDLVFLYLVKERIGVIIISAFVAHTAWHWMTDRWDILRRFTITMPELSAATLLVVVRAAMVVLVICAIWWLAKGVLRKRRTVS